jgi:kynurenine formamidase
VGPNANEKCSIHYWAEHGIAARGILLDYWGYAQANGIQYSPFTSHRISYADLAACGKAQGVDIRPAAQGGDVRPGDILFVRSGFVSQYRQTDTATRVALRAKHGNDITFAGVKMEEPMLDWLHDSYFAAVAGDAPSFEAWPKATDQFLHEYILAMWGMPLGEMLDLERLSERCRESGKWTFFFTSAPANMPGGVSTHVNGQAIL